MKKLLILCLTITAAMAVRAQDSTATPIPDTTIAPANNGNSGSFDRKRKFDFTNRANDHFMIQIGYNGWQQSDDTLKTKGIPRSFNFYFMYDFPFKSDPRFSVGAGLGIGTDNVYFDKLYVDITGKNVNRINIQDQSNTNHFKRFKLMTTYLEVPVELRWAANPENTNKSWKFAVGGKVGTMLAASTKGRILVDQNNNTINNYTSKEKSKRFFNTTRLSATARISKGIFGIYASYQINDFIKSGFGPDIRPFQIGFVLSGL